MINNIHNPDVLNCLANLSSDEVFTSPKIANEMLDMLPQGLFESPDTKFLDPCTKSGVFLREIAKRLLKGLETKIPDLQKRINHIFTNQLYGIAITKLTSLISKRSVYCSKTANGKYSIVENFASGDGNIKFDKIKHTFENHKCIFCGVSDSVDTYVRDEAMETHAYQFIHTYKPEEIFNMKFDVIVGNPPYQLNDGGGMGASAIPLYDKFVMQAKKMNPRYLTMIIPSRWFVGGKGLDDFRDNMLKDEKIRIIHDFIKSSDCFSGVEIKGGVCYFLWDRDNKGLCEVVTHNENKIASKMERSLLYGNSNVFIRYNDAISILKKINYINSFSNIVTTRNPFGLSNNTNYDEIGDFPMIKLYMINKKIGWLSADYIINKNGNYINKWKVLVPKAVGVGDMKTDILKPFIAEPMSICTETYLAIGPFNDKGIAENVISYINTKFFHFLLGLKKITQNSTRESYEFVPMQDFSKPWTDKELYEKYNLTNEEINFIESMVRPEIGTKI